MDGNSILYYLRNGDTEAAASAALEIASSKLRTYLKLSRRYRLIYFATRLLAGLAAGSLPFVVGHPTAATSCAVVVMVATVVDLVVNPGRHWGLYSRATDSLTMAATKLAGIGGDHASLLRIVERTEAATTADLQDISAVIAASESVATRRGR